MLQAESDWDRSLVHFSKAIDEYPDFVLYWRGYLKTLTELGKSSIRSDKIQWIRAIRVQKWYSRGYTQDYRDISFRFQ